MVALRMTCRTLIKEVVAGLQGDMAEIPQLLTVAVVEGVITEAAAGRQGTTTSRPAPAAAAAPLG